MKKILLILLGIFLLIALVGAVLYPSLSYEGVKSSIGDYFSPVFSTIDWVGDTLEGVLNFFTNIFGG